MAEAVYVIGGGQTDFAHRWSQRSEQPLLEMMGEAVRNCLEVAEVEPHEVESAHVGNFVAERFTGQSHLGAVVPMLDAAWSGLPAARHEAACASGSIAALAGMAEIEAGRYDLVLVIGVELMRNVPGTEAAQHLGCAAWAADELDDETLPWPELFDRVAGATEARYGLDLTHLSRIGELNRANAKRNPLAQTRGWTLAPGATDLCDDRANPVVHGRLRASDCGRITDGASAILLASGRFVDRWKRRRAPGAAQVSALRGWGHHAAPLPLDAKLRLSVDDSHLFPSVRAAALDAYRRAAIPGPEALDVVELHDCFTITEYVAIEHLGITAPGEAWKAIEDGRIESGGAIPVNPSGGLIGAGHPVGASGVRMILDIHRQVTGTAGDYQIEDASVGATLNIGGSFSTAVSFVIDDAREVTR